MPLLLKENRIKVLLNKKRFPETVNVPVIAAKIC